jgi:hypothetical protein
MALPLVRRRGVKVRSFATITAPEEHGVRLLGDGLMLLAGYFFTNGHSP